MLSFRKLTALITLMVFASHGTMAAPLPQVPTPEPLLDSLLGNLGHLIGTTVGDIVPGETTGQIIKGAGGIQVRQFPPTPEPLLDSLLGNLGHLVGTIVGGVAPGETTGQVIKGAGGIPL